MRRFSIALTFLIAITQLSLAQFQMEATPVDVQLDSRADGIDVRITSKPVEASIVAKDGHTYQAFTLPEEGTTFEYDRPILPSISRFIIVDSEAGIGFKATSDEPVGVVASAPPALCDDDKVAPTPGEMSGLYPPNFAEMSDPVIIRGVRMVKVTTFPYQYDTDSGNYIHRSNIQFEIVYNNDPPINPVIHPNRPHKSLEFRKFISAFAVNGDELFRDDPDFPTDYIGHYLVVVNEGALLWHKDFIEWRRKAGYKMEILSLSNNDALNTNTIKNAIKDRYDAYVDAGEEPFDELLLIGDRSGYDNLTVGPDRQLAAEVGETIWGGPNHADYKYANLDGDDNLPDVGFGRMPSGSQNIANLVVGRTLAYEMTPRMQNPEWFTRGMNYSQHWGNGEATAWHITIHTNARWGEEVLKSLGFRDVIFYEYFPWDQQGQRIGPEIRDALNSGLSLMVGRAENYFWRGNFAGVNDNTVFPINICVSGHGEWTAWNMFRTGDGNHLKGPVAATFGWGGPPTATSSYVWMQMVNGTCLKDMPLGWSRMYAITSIEKYFPNVRINPNNKLLYEHVKTDIDMHGDPGIHPWFGVPRLLEFDIPQSISPDASMIEARLTTVDGGNAAPGVQVTLYHQANMVLNNAAQYAGYEDYFRKISYTNEDGIVRFALEDVDLVAGKTLFITATGRDVRPVLGEVAVSVPRSAIDIADYSIEEVEGDGDNIPNSGETIDISLTAINLGNQNSIANVRAVVTSLSPFLTVENNDISFGDIEAGAEADGDAPVRVNISPRCPDAASRPLLQPRLLVTFTSGNLTWKSLINVQNVAPHFRLMRDLPNGDIIQTQVSAFNIDIDNVGSKASDMMTGRLVSLGTAVTVIRETAIFPEIGVGRHARIQGNVFSISGNTLAIPGQKCDMKLILSDEAGFRDTVMFVLQVGTPRENAPQGPDNYGYIAFDDTDRDWDTAPSYSWIEINPDDNAAEYDGEELGFRGQSEYDIGESIVVDLGFEMQFYGRRYSEITVSTNGFIAVGSQPRITNHQNWPLDEAIGGGVGMIAPFWDDLRLSQGGVYVYPDEEHGRFIVEWYRVHPASGNAEWTFQVILYDSDVWPTESGDQDILFQYKTISELQNLRNGDTEWINGINYESVGISSPDGRSGISYRFHGDGPVTSAALANRRAIKFSTAPKFKDGLLYGRVTDHATGEGIPEATVYTQHGYAALTDANGYYRIIGAPAEVDFTATARKDAYNDSTYEELWIDEGDSLECSFDLLHPEFTPSINGLSEMVSPDDVIETGFSVRNTGNGPLEWQVSRRLIGDANAAPWELRRSYNVGQITGDERIEGVIFAEDHFFVSGANGADSNTVYILDRDGELTGSWEQTGSSRYGYKDMDWDGNFIWAPGADSIYCLTTDGQVVNAWADPLNPTQYIACDRENGLLYLSGTTTNIVACDQDGHVIGNQLNRRSLRIYGLGYWPEDPDGHNLYILNKPLGVASKVTKMDTETGDTLMAAEIPQEIGSTGEQSVLITNEFDVYSWVMISIQNISNDNGSDKIMIHQLDARRDWFDVSPSLGVLDAGEEQQFDFTFDASNLPTVVFEGELFFSHNASEGISIIPVTLEVAAGPGHMDRRRLDLNEGWNQVSLNIVPEAAGVPEIVTPIVEQNILRLVKDGSGRFYRPDNGFNNIPNWNPDNGYLFYLDAPAELSVRGEVIAADRPIQLTAGWNLKSYFPRQPLDVRTAVASAVESLVLVKDVSGRFYMPAMNFSNMPPLQEGKGYYFKAADNVELVYPADRQNAPAALVQANRPPIHFALSGSHSSPDNHSLLVIGNSAMKNWEVAAVSGNGKIYGSARFDELGRAGIALWGDDPDIDGVDGAIEGTPFNFLVWDGTTETSVSITDIQGDPTWISGGVSVVAVTSEIPSHFGLTRAYPNPFNGTMRISYGIDRSGSVTLAAYDLSGRNVAILSSGMKQAGSHEIAWNAENLATGMYVIKLEQSGRSDIRKVVLVK